MVKLKVLPCHGHSSIRAWLFVFWINFVYLSAILLKEKCILVCFFFLFFLFLFFYFSTALDAFLKIPCLCSHSVFDFNILRF